MSAFTYLDELRLRLWRVVILFVLVVCLSCYFYPVLFEFMIRPIEKALPSHSHVITTSLVDLVYIPLQVSLWVGLLVSWPYLLMQLWKFFSPAMYKEERYFVKFWLCASSLMLWLGLFTGAVVLLPQMIRVMLLYCPSSIVFLPDVRHYLSFAVQCCLAVGVISQMPVVLWLALRCQWMRWHQLVAARRYVIVLSLVVGMLLPPPDVISQVLVAVPMWLLYECSLLVGWVWQTKQTKVSKFAESDGH